MRFRTQLGKIQRSRYSLYKIKLPFVFERKKLS